MFSRAEKRLTLPAASAELLGLPPGPVEPATVMQAILRAPADLLYFGGIGTYVKAGAESQAEAGDRANDAIRVDGADIRARVIGEGANLAITQAGRIEYARSGVEGAGGRVNTDALDNSAGVSTSDHEVNIKILLADAEREGVLTRRQRDDLLVAMTDEVGALVLRDNHQQSLAVSLEMQDGVRDLGSHAALMARLEAEGTLDRAVSGLPDAAALQARAVANEALLRPELAALLPVAKLWLTDAIEAAPAADDLTIDPAFVPALLSYFPTELQERFAPLIQGHRLRRELIATAIVNTVANRLGPAALGRLAMEGSPVRVARAAWLAGALFGLEGLYDASDAAPASAAVRLEAMSTIRRLHELAARDLLGATELDEPLEFAIATLRPGIAALTASATLQAAGGPAAERLRGAGLPDNLAAQVAAAPSLAAAPAIVRLAESLGIPPVDTAAAWHRAGQSLGIDDLRAAIGVMPTVGSFAGRAKAALLADLMAAQTGLARAAVRGMDPATRLGAPAVLQLAREAAAAPDFAGLAVATRAVAAMA